MAVRIGMVSLGCTKNQVDGERMLGLVRERGWEISPDPAECDAVIINTCGFIEDAKRESIETILEFARLKGRGRLRAVAVTGCLAERYREEVARELPEADVVLGIGSNTRIVQALERALAGGRVCEFGEKEALPLEGGRVVTTPPHTAYLKVAEGCDNRCTYCAIPLIRGRFRSRRPEDVLAEARELAAAGVRELNVIAQDTTRYGEDLEGRPQLAGLLAGLCKIEGLRWVRVLYAYPDRVTDELLEVMAREPKICKYIDIPLQHASGRILKAMNRRFDRESLTALLARVRRKVPGVTLRTTFITGFPGETDEDFAELCRFVAEVRFDRLGCFAYSAEEGTPAAGFPGQVDEEVKRRRAELIMEQQAPIMEAKNREKLGRTVEALVEGYDAGRGCYVGRTAADAPDIDGVIFLAAGRELAAGEFVAAQVTGVDGYDLLGRVKGGDA